MHMLAKYQCFAKAKDLHLPLVMDLFVMLISFGFFKLLQSGVIVNMQPKTLSCVHNHQLIGNRLIFTRNYPKPI